VPFLTRLILKDDAKIILGADGATALLGFTGAAASRARLTVQTAAIERRRKGLSA
jgi:hypothetical protein